MRLRREGGGGSSLAYFCENTHTHTHTHTHALDREREGIKEGEERGEREGERGKGTYLALQMSACEVMRLAE